MKKNYTAIVSLLLIITITFSSFANRLSAKTAIDSYSISLVKKGYTDSCINAGRANCKSANLNENVTIPIFQQQSSLYVILNAYQNGDMIYFNYAIYNSGNTTISSIYIWGQNTTIESLAPGAFSEYFYEEYSITTNDRYNGSVLIFVQAEGIDSNGIEVLESNTQEVVIEPYIFSFYMDGDYNDFNADGFVNVGDVINYNFYIHNYGTDTLLDLSVSNSWTELEISGNPITLQPGSTDNSTFSAQYVLKQSDINEGSINKNAKVQFTTASTNELITVYDSDNTYLSTTRGIRLNAFIDSNADGIQNSGEPNYSNANFQYEINNDGTIHNVSSYNGIVYLYESDPTTVYNLSCTLNANNPCEDSYSLVNSSYTGVTVPVNPSTFITHNFPITTTSCADAAIYIHGGVARPGFNYSNTITYKNNGNQIIPSGVITFTKDTNLSIISTSQAGTVLNANGFTYTFSNLLPFETRTITALMSVPTIPTVALGDLTTTSATISNPGEDIYLTNNQTSLTQTIVGAYDPNDKMESHGEKIVTADFTADEYLTYTIRFENTGTANAINIRVDDVLDNLLDETSVRMIAASGNYVLERSGSNLTWRFDGINLPPSEEDTMIGHGFIVFEVKPKPGYTIGDVIPNTASIYFDFNPAIVTNTFTTEFVVQLGTEDFASNDFIFYPNPVQNNLSLSHTEKINQVIIYSILGQKVFEATPQALQAHLDLSGLSSGTYLLKVKSENMEKTIRFIKE